MATRAELRTGLRTRLEDTTGDPLWTDATLNEAIVAAVRAYGLRAPRPATATVAISAGATAAAVPTLAPEAAGPLRVIDPRGRVVPPAANDPAGGGAAQTWCWWDGLLRFARPALGGDWRVEFLAPRQTPANDSAVVDCEAGDEELVMTLALAAALRGRATDDAKRGGRSGMAALAEAARADAARLFAARRRRARGGYLVSDRLAD